jgi:hypothetical protein
MRRSARMLAWGAVAVWIPGCQRNNANPKPPASQVTGTPSASDGSRSDEKALLLLDDGLQASSQPSGPIADNSRCHVCHLNYVQEELAVVHAQANIGCARCHGDSDAHIADESWASGGNGTPPGIMYTREKINPFCMDCHPRKKMNAAKHEPLFAGTAKEKYCTDCHGDHRLADRKCRWK